MPVDFGSIFWRPDMPQDEPWVLAVGKPFSPERTTWDDVSFEYRFFSGNHLLQLCLGSPSPKEIAAFKTSPVRVGLYLEGNVIFLLFRIEGCMEWSDQAFSIRLVDEKDQALPPLPPGLRILLTLILVNADSGIVMAIRAVTFSPHFSRLLHMAMRHQKDSAFNASAHQSTIEAVYRRFPNSKALAKAAVLIERAGAKTP